MQEKLVFQLDATSSGGGEHAVNNEKLISAIESLASQMGSFSGSMKEFITKSNNYNKDKNTHMPRSYAQETSRLNVQTKIPAQQLVAETARFAANQKTADLQIKTAADKYKADRQASEAQKNRDHQIAIQNNRNGSDAANHKRKTDYLALANQGITQRLGLQNQVAGTRLQNTQARASILLNPDRIANDAAKNANNAAKISHLNSPEVLANATLNAQSRNISAGSNAAKNQALLKKQDNLSALMDKANEYEKSGDSKFAKELLRDISTDINGAIKKSATSKLSQIVALSSIPIAGRAFDKLMGADVTAGSSIMQNPITNGFNYGSQVSGVMNANSQRRNAYIEGIGAAAGGIAGKYSPVSGVAIMAGTQAISSYLSAGNALKSQAIETKVNNAMGAEALGATNQRASNLSGGGYSVTDAQYPLVTAMKKAAGAYNKNFKAIDQLTDYTIAAQLTMQQSTSMAAATGFLTKGMNTSQSKDFVNNMTSTFSAYGVSDPAAAAVNAITLKQSGMSSSAAIDTIARSTGLNPGMQSMQAAYYGDTISGRTMNNYVAKTLAGVDLPNLMSGKGDPKAAEYRKNLLKAQKDKNPFGGGAMAMWFDRKYNLSNYQEAEAPTSVNGNVTSTKTQRGFIAATNALTAENSKDFTIGKGFAMVNEEATHTSFSLKDLAQSVIHATTQVDLLSSVIGRMSKNNGSTSVSSSTNQMPKPKSGTTGSMYTRPKVSVGGSL